MAFGLWRYLHRPKPVIQNFEQCVRAGYEIEESYPQKCTTSDGKVFENEAQRAKADAPPPPAQTNLAFQTVVSGDNRGTTKAGRVVITDRATWVKFWNSVHAHLSPLPPLIEVDFSKEMVVAVNMGPEPTSGYAVKVADIIESSAEIRVKIQEISPAKGCVSAQVLTNPYHVVRTTKSPKPVIFDRITEIGKCK